MLKFLKNSAKIEPHVRNGRFLSAGLHGNRISVAKTKFFDDRCDRSEGCTALQSQIQKGTVSGGTGDRPYGCTAGNMHRRRSRTAVGKSKVENHGFDAARPRSSCLRGSFPSFGRAQKEAEYSTGSIVSYDAEGGSFDTASSSYTPLPSPSQAARPRAGSAHRRKGVDPRPTGNGARSALGGGGRQAVPPGGHRTTLSLGTGKSGEMRADSSRAREESGDVSTGGMDYEAHGGWRGSTSEMNPLEENIWEPFGPEGGRCPVPTEGVDRGDNRWSSKFQSNGQQLLDTAIREWGLGNYVSSQL